MSGEMSNRYDYPLSNALDARSFVTRCTVAAEYQSLQTALSIGSRKRKHNYNAASVLCRLDTLYCETSRAQYFWVEMYGT